jgi:HK97 family phage portal protein
MSFWNKILPFKRSSVQIEGARRYITGASNVFINEDVAMTVSAFHRGVTYISTQISKLPWNVKDKENEIQLGGVADLIDLAPNPEMNALTWRLFMVQNAILHGNAYSEIERDMAGRPIALWPIASKSVELVRAYDGALFYKIAKGSSTNPGEDVYLRASDVFHLKNFHTKDGLVGQGLVAFARETLGIAVSADRMASGIFQNGGMPAGVLKFPGKLSDEAYERLKKSWTEQHAGRKAGGVAILEDGALFEALNLEPEVLQFLESRKFGVLEVALFLGLPPTKLFDSATATYSNVENANLEVATDTLDAWACNLEMEADVKLLKNRHGGRFTELDLYAVFRGDMTTRANYFSKMMQCGAITPNQIRAREGLAGYPGGERYYIAVNNFTPSDRLDEVLDAQMKSKEQKDVSPEKNEDEEKDKEKELTQAAIAYLTK